MSPSRTARAVLGSALLTAALLPLSAVAAPAAESPTTSVVVTPSSGLDRAGQSVSVSVSGVPEGTGIYLQWCPDNPAGTRWPSGTCASSPKVWASSSATAQGMGAQPLSGSPFTLALTPTITTGAGTTDCLTTGCAVFVRLDHYSPGDTSLDRFVPVTFAPEATPTPPPTPTPTPTETAVAFDVDVTPTTGLDPAGDEVSVTVAGLPDDAGIYVRLCALAGSARPGAADCDGQGRWVRETYPYGPYPTDGSVVKPSAGAFTMPVAASFGAVDCSVVACGIHVRRDHLAAADTSYDLAIPLTFAAESPSPSPSTSATPTPAPTPTTTPSATPTPTPTPDPTLSLGSTRVVAGGSLAVDASGFAAGEDVVAMLYSEPTELGTAAADGDGTLSASFTVPSTTPAGTHTLELTGAESGATVSTTITVTAATIPADNDSDSPGSLAQTGADGPMLGLAAALVGAGLALVLSTVRRRPAVASADSE